MMMTISIESVQLLIESLLNALDDDVPLDIIYEELESLLESLEEIRYAATTPSQTMH